VNNLLESAALVRSPSLPLRDQELLPLLLEPLPQALILLFLMFFWTI